MGPRCLGRRTTNSFPFIMYLCTQLSRPRAKDKKNITTHTIIDVYNNNNNNNYVTMPTVKKCVSIIRRSIIVVVVVRDLVKMSG